MSFNTKSLNPFHQYEVQNSPQDTVSQISWASRDLVFAASSWDCSVSSWKVQYSGNQMRAVEVVQIKHNAPVLCCHVSGVSFLGLLHLIHLLVQGRIFSGGCDNIAKVTAYGGYNLGVGNSGTFDFGKHDSCIRTIHHIPRLNMIATTGWDRKIRYWDDRLKSNGYVFEFQLPERAYAADACKNVFVVCCGGKQKNIGVFDLRNYKKIRKSDKSPLRLQTRCCAVMPSCEGYVIGSIEGRVAVQYFQGFNKNSFAFKCHREGSGQKKKHCFAVNDISFHPQYGTFSTCGSNGRFNFWDLGKQIKVFGTHPKKFSVPLTCGQFSPDGKIYAQAACYDFSQGTEVPIFKSGFTSKIILQKSTRKMHS